MRWTSEGRGGAGTPCATTTHRASTLRSAAARTARPADHCFHAARGHAASRWHLAAAPTLPCPPPLDLPRSWCVGDYCAIDADGTKPTAKKKKKKGSLGESFAVIRSSPKVPPVPRPQAGALLR